MNGGGKKGERDVEAMGGQAVGPRDYITTRYQAH